MASSCLPYGRKLSLDSMALFHRLLRSRDASRLDPVWRNGVTTTLSHLIRCVTRAGRKSITDAAPTGLRSDDEHRTNTRKVEFPTRTKKTSKWSHTPGKDSPKAGGHRNVEGRRRRRNEPDADRQRPRFAGEESRDARIPRDPEPWQVQKAALQKKFKEDKWQPRKRLSPDAIEGIRALHAQYPDKYTTPVLAAQFEVSPEAIRRILKSKWRPTEEEAASRSERWLKRGEKIWTQMVELGVKPPKKWREMGIGRARPHGGRWRTSRLDESARRALSEGRLSHPTSSSQDPGALERTSLAERIL